MNGAITTAKHERGLYASEKTFNLLIRILVYSSAFYFFSFITVDPDLWGHIKFGGDLWEAKALNRFDIYSYTAFGSEWINHEWLSELVMYFVYHIFGSPGLLIGKILLGFAVVYLLSRINFHRACDPLVYAFVFLLAVFVMSPGFMIRPQLFTFLFVSYFFYVFHMYLERGKNLMWSLPLVMVLWVNCHGGFVVGLGMFPLVVVCVIIFRRKKNKDKRYVRSLLFWMVLTEISVLINPYGYHLLTFLYKTLSTPRDIWEWNPIGIFDLSHLRFKILAILVLVSLFWNKKGKRLWELGIVIIALVYAFRSQRHTVIFAIVAAPCLTENLSLAAKKIALNERLKSLPGFVILNVFLFVLIGYQILFTADKYIKTQFNIMVDPMKYPIYAVRFLKDNGIKGNILLPFEWGEYAIWKLYPDSKVSIDGRFKTAYPEEVLDNHLGAFHDTVKLRQLLTKYPPNILLARQNPSSLKFKSTQRDWIYVYSDPISIVFIKDGGSQRDVLEKFQRKELIYPDKDLSVYFP